MNNMWEVKRKIDACSGKSHDHAGVYESLKELRTFANQYMTLQHVTQPDIEENNAV